MNKDYVLISLYVDDKTPLKQPVEVKLPDGTSRTLRTIGDKWSYLEQTKFGYLAQPFYVPLDNAGKPLNGSFSFRRMYLLILSSLIRDWRIIMHSIK